MDECEEWERHEATTDDPWDSTRSKSKQFEPEIELVWEKGGPGIVWYTDTQFWRQFEGDFDEQTSDDLDVDYSGYYEDGAGDRDARAAAQMRRSESAASSSNSGFGVFSISDFDRRQRERGRGRAGNRRGRRARGRNQNLRFGRGHQQGAFRPQRDDNQSIGEFEVHTKGVGRRILESQGWRDGTGLGRSEQGIADALEADGQTAREGFGYHGERVLSWRVVPRSAPKKTSHTIGSIYDKSSGPVEECDRRLAKDAVWKTRDMSKASCSGMPTLTESERKAKYVRLSDTHSNVIPASMVNAAKAKYPEFS